MTIQNSPNPAVSTLEFSDLVRVFARIGCLSFGGPAGQIALMHSEVVEKRHWVDEEHYLHALNFCHLLPGPEAQQLATWIGWRLHGLKGGLAALTAAVVGVIANLSVWFALHVLFARVTNTAIGPLRIQWPDPTSLDWRAAVLTVAAAVMLFGLKWSIFRMLAVTAAAVLALGRI